MRFCKVIAITILMSGCASFQDKANQTLANAQGATTIVTKTLVPIVDGLCRDAAMACRDLGDQQCQALVSCSKIRDQVINAIIATHYAILDANMALALGDEEATWDAIDRALELLRNLRIQMRELGIGT